MSDFEKMKYEHCITMNELSESKKKEIQTCIRRAEYYGKKLENHHDEEDPVKKVMKRTASIIYIKDAVFYYMKAALLLRGDIIQEDFDLPVLDFCMHHMVFDCEEVVSFLQEMKDAEEWMTQYGYVSKRIYHTLYEGFLDFLSWYKKEYALSFTALEN